ncbi:MAG: RNA polymerase subunit sigma, partial [Clostridia bacterium]|nr:RNA polymerase subunit sigma [Clostridia bacterium]
MTNFEKIYKEYFNDVYLYIKRLSGDEHVAEDITSETFFKALKSIDSFRGECEIRVWL